MTSTPNKTLWAVLALLPFCFLVYWGVQFSINMPYLDEWDLAVTIQKSYEGTLTARDLFDQHNESRILFPRLIMIPLAHCTNWNIHAEVCGILLLAGLIFLLLARQAVRTFRQCVRRQHPWLLVVVSCLLFSVLQYENWSFGFTLIGFMNLVAAVIGLVLLATPVFSWPRFVGALLAGTVAMYSYSNGILFWVVGLLPLCAVLREDRVLRLKPLIVWIVWAVLAVALFYTGYQKPTCMPPLKFFIYHPGMFLGYFCALLGGAFANTPTMPIWVPVSIGASGCVLFGVTGLIVIFRDAPTSRTLSFWLALGGYAALGALAIAIGRAANGIPHALESRYTILSALFWIPTLVLTVITLDFAGRAPVLQHFRRGVIALKAALVVFLLLCAGLFGVSSAGSLELWQAKHDSLLDVRDELLCFLPDQSLLARSFPDPAKLKPRMEFLTKQGLSLFRERKPFQEYKVIPVMAGSLTAVRTNIPPATGLQPNLFLIEGKAYNSDLRQKAYGVILVNTQDVIVARTRVEPTTDFSQFSWKVALFTAKFPPGPVHLDIYSMLGQGDLIALIGQVDLDIPPAIAPQPTTAIVFVDPAPQIAGCADHLRIAQDQVYGSGWARNPATGQPGTWVIVTDEEHNILAYTRVGEDRDDVARQLWDPALVKSGWRLAFHQSRLTPGAHRLAAWLFLPDEHKALKLLNEFEVSIPALPKLTNSSPAGVRDRPADRC